MLNSVDPKQESYVTVLLLMAVVVNNNFVGYLLTRYINTFNILTMIIVIIGLDIRIYGYQNFGEDLSGMLTNFLVILLILPCYMYCNIAFINIIKK